ncbi:hypothetical protein QTP86_002353 [Hemibagrus guttatus]|nr:hypothetical protein QTP86_002353 [Hemibagrus guttatus]
MHEKCDEALATPLSHSAFSSSSVFTTGYTPEFAKLNRRGGAGGWSPLDTDHYPWLQVDLGSRKQVTAVATQGRYSSSDWTTRYRLLYSDTGRNWKPYHQDGNIWAFTGNSNTESVVRYDLQHVIVARFLRFIPLEWSEEGRIGLRIEIYGCMYWADVINFDGQAVISYRFKMKKMKILKDVIALKFKTAESDGVILHGEGQQGDYITLELRGGRLVLQINLGSNQYGSILGHTSVSSGSLLDDHHWHSVVIERHRRNVNFTLDLHTQHFRTNGEFDHLDLDYEARRNLTFSCVESHTFPISFNATSFLQLPGRRENSMVSVSFQFRTWNSNGLLVFSALADGMLELTLKDGKVTAHISIQQQKNLGVDMTSGKGRELADVMERRKVDILCVQETRWKGSKARSIGAGFKLFYYGVDSKRNGVGVVLKEEFVRNVLEVKRVSDRVMSLKLEIEGVMLNVVSGYAPQVGCELEEKERFWSELDEVMESIPTGERVVIGADFNGHVGEGNTGDEEVMGKFGVKERNLEGQMVVDFAKRMDMGVVNTYFQKREEHRVTYKSGGRRTQVDYILCRRGNLKEIIDCKVVVGESVARQHRMVVCRMTLMVCKTKRSKIEKKTKWWKLKKEECCEEFRQKLRQALGGQVVLPDDWETTAEVIRETGRKVLGVSSGRRKEDKETWWWNEEVQDSIQRKRLAKKKWDMDRTEENRQEYKELQRRVKREVSKAKQKAYEELYTRLDTREGEKDLYRLARQRDRDGKDVQQVRVIKDRDGRVLTSEESVQRRWKEYFEELMNEENEREKRVEGVNSVEQKVDKIRKDEVRKALKRMKSGKAVGPDDIPVEVWKKCVSADL